MGGEGLGSGAGKSLFDLPFGLATVEGFGAIRSASEIENQGFRELRQGYHLLKYPQRTGPAVRAHMVLTLVIYSLVNAYKSQRGQRLAHLGIRRWRGKQMGQSIHKMIVYYEGINSQETPTRSSLLLQIPREKRTGIPFSIRSTPLFLQNI